jgi:hypothetical protein
MTPGTRICFPMQAQRNSTACPVDRRREVTFQGSRMVSSPGSGGSEIKGLEGTGRVPEVGNQRIIDSAELLLALKLNPDSLSAEYNPAAPAS